MKVFAPAMLGISFVAGLIGVALAGEGHPGPVMIVNVAVFNYDPVIRSEGDKRLHEVFRWNDPRKLAQGYSDDLRQASGGTVLYYIAMWRDLDEFPLFKDGTRFGESEYLAMSRKRQWPSKQADYAKQIQELGLVGLINSGDIDEVWLFGGPYFGWWESQMVGPTAYWCNSVPIKDRRFQRNFVIMGFNFERDVDCMLENFSHRTESIMTHVYGRWDCKQPYEKLNAWERFTLYDKIAPGRAACGNVHFAPSSEHDYDWGNKRQVWSTCDDWLNYPHLTGKKRKVECSEWGNGDMRLHHIWWLSHLPRAPGHGPDGKLANWWKYVVDFNKYPESR